MKHQKSSVLGIFATVHALLFLGLLYPLIAGMTLSQWTVFWRFCACSLVLLIPLIFGRLLLYWINHLIVYITISVILTIFSANLASFIAGKGQTSGIIASIVTIGYSIFIFLVHCLCKIRYGQIKNDFIALHGEDAVFSLPGPETSNLLIKPDLRHLVWNSILYVTSMIFNLRLCLYVIFGMTVVDLFCIIGYKYSDALYSYITQRQHVANLPITTMKQIHKIIGVFGALLLALFLLPAILYGHELEIHLKTGVPDFPQQMQGPNDYHMTDDSDDFIDLTDNEERETPKWLIALSKVLGYIALSLCVLFIMTQIVHSLRVHTKEFAANGQDEVVFLKSEDSHSHASVLHHRNGEGHLSVNQQIRRRYRNTIRKATKGQPNNWATPSELEQAASLPDNETTALLHNYYEKARYSESGCSNEELRALR